MPEIGTRKVVGARNRDFILQFLVQSAVINFFSVLLAITIVQLVKSPVEILFHFYVADWKILFNEHYFILFLTPVSGIIVTGVYPALISSKKGSANF